MHDADVIKFDAWVTGRNNQDAPVEIRAPWCRSQTDMPRAGHCGGYQSHVRRNLSKVGTLQLCTALEMFQLKDCRPGGLFVCWVPDNWMITTLG